MEMETEYGTPRGVLTNIITDPVRPKIASYSQLDDDEFEYETKKCRGLAIIINNFSFNNRLPGRDYSKLDVNSLVSALRFVGFRNDDFEHYENLTARQMFEVSCMAATTKNYKTIGSILLIVLSHGDEQNVYGVDCETISYEQLLQPIRKASTDRLQGIPKLLLVQACHLSLGCSPCPVPMHISLQPHRSAGARPSALLSADDQRLTHDADAFGPSKPYSTACQSDIVIAYSTLKGTEGGSKFIQAFCEVMRKDGRRLEITTMFARASRLMSYTPGTSVPNKSLPPPCVISQLKRGFYFS